MEFGFKRARVCVVCGSPLFGAGHADVLSSSMEDVVEEEVIASGSAGGGGSTYCDYADGKSVARFLDLSLIHI